MSEDEPEHSFNQVPLFVSHTLTSDTQAPVSGFLIETINSNNLFFYIREIRMPVIMLLSTSLL